MQRRLITYEGYEKLMKELEDIEDLKHLRKESFRSLSDVLSELKKHGKI